METLFFDNLPTLPQVSVLRSLAHRIWQQEGVVALWLGGSLARGTADKFSDIDLRICVSVDAAEDWEQPDFDLLFDGDMVGSRYSRFGQLQLYQIMTGSGYIVDLTVQTIEQKPPQDYVYLIGCRDEDFRCLLVSIEPDSAYTPKPADAVTVRQIVTDFWIDSSKTQKVLYRNLDIIAMVGIDLERVVLMRLWHILATGTDTGMQRPTIHGLTAVVRHISSLLGYTAQELLGLPLRNQAEVSHAVEANRNEVARVGQILSERLAFDYPLRLENTVRAAWNDITTSSALVSEAVW